MTRRTNVEGRASPARVLIADDHALAREGMRILLASDPGIEMVDEANDGEEALRICRELCPDLVLMDVRMPKMDGLEATRAIKKACPQTAVLMVTAHEGQDYLLEAIRAGAAGYILKDSTKAQLIGAVRQVLDGESPLDQELAMQLIRRLADEVDRRVELRPAGKRREEPTPGALTPRELEVLRLLTAGKTNRQISRELHLSISTVKTHLEHIIAKLEVSDRTQAAVKAVELGLFP